MLAHCHLFEPSYHLFKHLHHLLINFEQHHHLLFWYAAFHLKNRALRHLFEQLSLTIVCLFVFLQHFHLLEHCVTYLSSVSLGTNNLIYHLLLFKHCLAASHLLYIYSSITLVYSSLCSYKMGSCGLYPQKNCHRSFLFVLRSFRILKIFCW